MPNSNYERAVEMYDKLGIKPKTSLYLVICPTAYGIYDSYKKMYSDMESIKAWQCCKVFNYLDEKGGILKCTDIEVIKNKYNNAYPDLRELVKFHPIKEGNSLTPIKIDRELIRKDI